MGNVSKHNLRGFTLVEMAIVLAILGLLTGVVIGGQSMLRNANIAKVLSDAKLYATAKEQFRLQYGQLPGDFSRATSVWGDDAAACADGAITDGIPGTCNGNGNGSLSVAGSANATAEVYQLWKQLALAGYIQGSYTGLNGPNGALYDTTLSNSPTTAITSTTFWHYHWGVQAGDASWFAGDYRNTMTFGGLVSGNWPYQNVLTPNEARNFDAKADDGIPGLGNVRSRPWLTTCVSGTNQFTATYLVDRRDRTCMLIFLQDFQRKNAV